MTATFDLAQDPDLAAAALRALGLPERLAYAEASAGLSIGRHSLNFPGFFPDIPNRVTGRQLSELFDELVGAEDELALVADGRQARLQLSMINRELPDGSRGYYNLNVFYQPENDAWPLLVILEQDNATGQMEQELVQERNEVRLIQEKLARANAELQRLNRLKSLLFSMAAHDMRAPITVVQGFADLLMRQDNPRIAARSTEFLRTIRAQAEALDKLITNLLDLDQIEQGSLRLQPSVGDLRLVIQSTYELLVPMALLHKQELTISLPEETVLVNVDAGRFQQIAYNLISNAIKYTPERGHVDIVLEERDDHAVLSVSDTGPGIAADELATLFRPYARTDDARRSSIVGSGLGLYIVKSLTEAHDGAVSVSSQVGVGTSFMVQVPLAVETPAYSASDGTPSPARNVT